MMLIVCSVILQWHSTQLYLFWRPLSWRWWLQVASHYMLFRPNETSLFIMAGKHQFVAVDHPSVKCWQQCNKICVCVKIREDKILEYIVPIWDMIMIEMKCLVLKINIIWIKSHNILYGIISFCGHMYSFKI